MTRLVAQESVVLLKFCKKMAYCDAKCHFVYTMKIHKLKVHFISKNILIMSHNMDFNKIVP